MYNMYQFNNTFSSQTLDFIRLEIKTSSGQTSESGV